MYDGFPYLNMQFSKQTDFVPVPDWIKDVEYPEEQERGYEFKEDLISTRVILKQILRWENLLFFRLQQKK